MSRALRTIAAALLLLPAAAQAQAPGAPVASKNVELVKNIATHVDSPGGRLVGRYFYLTTERDLTIYDVSAPANPVQVGRLDFGPTAVGNFYFPKEDPDTNGEILITSNEGAIEVIDVRDKTRPKFLAKLPGTAQHTISCALDCTWAYGSEGSIVDLRDPANPKLAGDWRKQHPNTRRHDVTEVAPGFLLTSTQPMYLLDVRQDPTRPKRLATVANADGRLQHANLWPNAMQDEMALVAGEEGGPQCSEASGASFQTYRTTGWQETQTFSLLDEFRLDPGFPTTTGTMPDSTYCVHWFSTHPTYRNGGMVAISWYEQGTRFLNVGRDGQISEAGYFIPLGSSASAAYWITDRIVYVADYNRGLDVLRFTGDLVPGEAPPATAPGEATPPEAPAGRARPEAIARRARPGHDRLGRHPRGR